MDDMLEDKRRSKGEATRMALLEAALVLFGERGFEGTSTRDIAGLAGCNQGLISFHFGGKEGLYDAARTVIFENLGSIVRGAWRMPWLPGRMPRRCAAYCRQRSRRS